MNFPIFEVPMIEIPIKKGIHLFLKREDLIDEEISGNKYWKLFYNINEYLENQPKNPQIITFGGAFSNHISAVSTLGKKIKIPNLGIIRGEELENSFTENPTLRKAHENGMKFRFVTRSEYRDKEKLTENLKKEFPNALIIPEGGSNKLAVKGIQYMLKNETKNFNYLCSAVGTGGTLAGISKYAEENQQVIGFSVVKDESLESEIFKFSGKRNFILIPAEEGGYGKISEELVNFINDFKKNYGIALDPIYTGKMMKGLFQKIEEGYFPEESRILAFHTGGLQGIEGANNKLEKQNRNLIL